MSSGSGLAKRRVLRGSSCLAAVAACLATGSGWAVVPVHCVSLEVPAPFILPDGAVRPAGELRLCLDRNLNPVTGMHRVYVEQMPVGFLMSRVTNAEISGDTVPSVLFRVEEGRLRLVGYTLTANGKAFSYRLWNPRNVSGADIAAKPGAGGDAEHDDTSVLLAARVN